MYTHTHILCLGGVNMANVQESMHVVLVCVCVYVCVCVWSVHLLCYTYLESVTHI